MLFGIVDVEGALRLVRNNGAGTPAVNLTIDSTLFSSVSMNLANGPSAGNAGTSLSISGGTGNTTGAGGSLSYTGGTGGGSSGLGGQIQLKSGTGGATNGNGGPLLLQSGDGAGAGTGGRIDLIPGAGSVTQGVIRLVPPGTGIRTAPELQFFENAANGTNFFSLKAAAAMAGNNPYTWPDAYPVANGRVLSSTTAGVMSWAASLTGPGSSTNTGVALWSGTGGSTLQDSNLTYDQGGQTLAVATGVWTIRVTAASSRLILGGGTPTTTNGIHIVSPNGSIGGIFRIKAGDSTASTPIASLIAGGDVTGSPASLFHGGELILSAGLSTSTANGARGGNLNLNAGQGRHFGGDVDITSGASTALSAAPRGGGNVLINTPPQVDGTASRTGFIEIRTGNNGTTPQGISGGVSGKISLITGYASNNSRSGDIELLVGDAADDISSSAVGGDIRLIAGRGRGGGAVDIAAGGVFPSGGPPGDLQLRTQSAVVGSSDPAGRLSIFTGHGNNGQFSGDIKIVSGGGQITTQGGGWIECGAGEGAPTGVGGSAVFRAGNGGSTSGNGGAVTVRGGDTNSGTGGAATFRAGEGIAAGNGGVATFRAGDGKGSGTGAIATFRGGDGGTTDGSGGAAIFRGGDCQSNQSSISGGNATLQGGSGGLLGTGGTVRMEAGGGAIGGSAQIFAKNSTQSGVNGGFVDILAGNGTLAANGGDVTITAGDGSSASQQGGNIFLRPGSGGNPHGRVIVTPVDVNQPAVIKAGTSDRDLFVGRQPNSDTAPEGAVVTSRTPAVVTSGTVNAVIGSVNRVNVNAAGAPTIVLPAPNTCAGQWIWVVKVDTSTNGFTIDVSGGTDVLIGTTSLTPPFGGNPNSVGTRIFYGFFSDGSNFFLTNPRMVVP